VTDYSPLETTLLWLFLAGIALPFAKAAWDIVIVITGSTIVLVFVYVPDLAYYCRQGYQRLSGENNRKGEHQR
jgi:hypothetical protein